MKTIITKTGSAIKVMATPADILYNRPEPAPVAPKNRDYCIIDHIGSLESDVVMKKAYSIAYSLTQHPKTTYTMKKFCQMLSRNPETKVSDKQKNFVRFNKHPEQVILICSVSNGIWNEHTKEFELDDPNADYDRISGKIKWIAEKWAERSDSVTIIACNDTTVEVRSMNEEHPEWFSCKDPVDSIYRRCANIWSRALGWQFSAPLYRDKASEIDVMKYKRYAIHKEEDINVALAKACPMLKDLVWYSFEDLAEKVNKAYIEHKEWFDEDALRAYNRVYADRFNIAHAEPDDHRTKTNHSPASYLNSKALASEDECREFFNYYKYLKLAGILEESLEPDYMICPECGRPMRRTAEDCDWCNYHQDAVKVDTFWEDSFHIYYTEEGMAFGCKNE